MKTRRATEDFGQERDDTASHMDEKAQKRGWLRRVLNMPAKGQAGRVVTATCGPGLVAYRAARDRVIPPGGESRG